MKLPHLQFYVGDWRKAVDVQSHTFHDRGVWFELLCFMHESEQRGKLIVNGRALDDESICRMLGLDKQVGCKTIQALLDSGVASRDPETGALMCRRMVRDEQLRKVRAESGKKGGNPALLKQKPTTPDNQNPDNDNDIGSGSSPPRDEGSGEGPDCVCEPSKFSKARTALHYLNLQAGRKYRETAENLSVIQARIDEVKGDLDGVRQMIERQCALWKGKDQEEYLRPATLFGKQKFGAYYDNRDQPIVRNGSTRPIHRADDELPDYTGVGTSR